MNESGEVVKEGVGLLKRVVLRSYAIPGGLVFGITQTAKCRNRTRNEEILQQWRKDKSEGDDRI